MHAKSIVQEILFFLDVAGLETRGNRGAWGTTGVQYMAAVVVLCGIEQSLNTGLDEAPGTGVERLFLSPDDVLGIGIAVEVLLQLSPWEGVKLLDTSDGGVADTLRITVLGKSSIYLARTHNNTLNLLRLVDRGTVSWVGDDPLEVRFASEFFKAGASDRMTQQGFREEDDKCYKKKKSLVNNGLHHGRGPCYSRLRN